MSENTKLPDGATDLSPIKRALLAVEQMKGKLDAIERSRTEPIAIVGIGCRFPGASGPQAFWELLERGGDAVREVPADRWRIDEYFDPDPAAAGKMYTRRAGFIDHVDRFDPQFFGISPREAAGIDPQQRLLLEVCWEALEDAGQAPDRLRHSPTGVYVGIVTSDYATMQWKRDDVTLLDAYSQSGLAFSIASGRVSYVLGLQGPCMSIDTACSSSLVATHLACQALRLGECRMALAGGVHLILIPDNSICYSRARMLAPDGRCKTFDAAADGFVEGEGCGIVVLKRLSDAVADGDRIVALVRGSAVNQDGPSGGLTVPNGPSQEAVIRDALARSGMEPARIGYVEAHGTGTSLGDPIEVRALGSVLGGGRPSGDRVAMGSVKTNIGHLQSASGVAGLIKLALALQQKTIPAHLHFTDPSPHIPWNDLPVTVFTETTAWPAGSHPRAGGVSAFGFSGTNAHVILEEAPASEPTFAGSDRPLGILTLSAASESALATQARAWAECAEAIGDVGLPNLAFTANTGRAQLPYRLAVAARTSAQVASSLRLVASGDPAPEVSRGIVRASDRPKVAFLFTGQGAQYVGMARGLYETQPTFRAAIDRCESALAPLLERSLLSVLYSDSDAETINQTVYTQPALFAVEYGLAELWRTWGVTPGAVLGHSLGEYVGACVAGVFPVERALALVAARARLMQSLPPGGAMTAVLADESVVRSAVQALGNRVSVAAVNGPRQVVISGGSEAIAAVTARLVAAGATAEPLTVSHAFHSSLMDPILDAFEAAVREANPQPPQLAVVSNLTGAMVRRELTESGYWRRHLREPVRFADGVKTLHAAGYRLFVEVGPRPVLTTMAQRLLPGDATCWSSLRRGGDDWEQILATVRELYVRGVPIDWNSFDRDYPRRRLSLPTYPFERTRYWVAETGTDRRPGGVTPGHALLGAAVRTALGYMVFDRMLSAERPRYLADHRKHGATLFPATAYLEMGFAAGDEWFGPGSHRFEDLVITTPLALPESGELHVQVVLAPEGAEAATFQLFSRRPTDEAWTLHATGTLRGGAGGIDAPVDLGELRSRCLPANDGEAEAYYAAMRADGHEFGPAFQVIRSLERGPECAVARVELAEGDRADAAHYHVHPALLDGALQLIGAALPPPPAGSSDTYVPTALERVTLHEKGISSGWVGVAVRQVDSATRTLAADVWLFDDHGRPVASIAGVYLKPVGRNAVAGAAAGDEWVHELAWIEKGLNERPAGGVSLPGALLVFGDRRGAADALMVRLQRAERVCISIARTGKPGSSVDRLAVDPADAAAVGRLYRELRAKGPVAGVVWCWPLDADASEPLSPGSTGGPIELLHLVQALVADPTATPPRLWVTTRGARSLGEAPPALEQAGALGLCRSIAAEYPEMQCTVIDLPPDEGLDDEALDQQAASLVEELDAGDREDQIAYRRGKRYVVRVHRAPPKPARGDRGAIALEIDTRGVLETLTLRPAGRRPPGVGQVEVRVDAAGLNFRDALNAMGMYEGPAGALGSEFVGTVVVCGDGVAMKPGQRVMGMVAGAFQSYVCVDASTVVAAPLHLGVEESATLPIVFLTAIHALEELAHLRRGERVLIHAAAGGVGLAAIQVAQQLGAEVIATAGSDVKRDYLRALGIRHVFSSRSLEFADQVRAATNGTGVDVLLNSLNGDFIAAGVSVLATGGRFVEIGKAGIWSHDQMAAVRPDVAYHTLYLGDLDNATLQRLYGEVADRIAAGAIRPLPHTTYALADAEQAFRYMVQARHIGKVVLRIAEPDEVVVREHGAYIVTGAFGGLGRMVADWLASKGARHLVLVGRQGARGDGAGLVQELESRGVRVQAIAADVGQSAAVASVFASIDPSVPVRGVIHAAGVLDDGVLTQQTRERFETVFRPKVAGAWHLHRQTRDLPLDFFVLFSSMVTIVGGPGQGNYAAANAVLDALAAYRRARGLPGTTINWGPWADVGMSAAVSEQDRRRWRQQGIRMIGREEGTALLGRFVGGAPAQVAVLPVEWPVLLQQFPPGKVPPLFEDLDRAGSSRARAGRSSAEPTFLTRLREAPAVRRPSLVLIELTGLVHKILGLSADATIDPHRPLQEYGLDSLMAVELRNSIGGLLEQILPATLLFKYPTLDALVSFALESTGALATVALADKGHVDNDAAEVAKLSDEEVNRLLAEELGALSSGLLGDL